MMVLVGSFRDLSLRFATSPVAGIFFVFWRKVVAVHAATGLGG